MEESSTPCPPRRTTNNHISSETTEDGSPPLIAPNTREDVLLIEDLTALSPTRENEWPHGLLPPYEPSGPRETAFSTHVAPNGGSFPRATIPLDRALLGIGPTQRKAILDEQESTLLLVIFNGGRVLFSGIEDKVGLAIRAKLEEMAKSCDFEVYHPISVLDDIPGPGDDMGHLRLHPLSKDNKYAPPYTYIVTNLPTHLRHFLTEVQTIGFAHLGHPFGFHALPVDDTIRSWVVGIYNSMVPANGNALKLIRKAIILSLASDNVFRQKIGQARRTNISLDKLTSEVLSSLSVRSIPGYLKGLEGYLVCISPFTDDPAIFDNVKSYVRTKTFVQGLFRVTPCLNPSFRGGDMVICATCKLDTHHTHSCPFHNMKDWWGPSSTISKEQPPPGTQTMRGSSSGRPNR
jgi:hypothetical protein